MRFVNCYVLILTNLKQIKNKDDELERRKQHFKSKFQV